MILYFLKAALICSGLYLIYKLILSNIASFKFNRFYLLATLLVSILLPSISFDYPASLVENSIFMDGSKIISDVSAIGSKFEKSPILQQNENNASSIFLLGYLCICILLSFRLIHNSRRLLSQDVQKGDKLNGMQLIFQKKNETIFSFFNRLYVPAKYKTDSIDEAVLLHESIHSKQLHSLDNVLSEIYLIVFWFNPFAWLLKKSIKSNHEYLADAEVVQNTEQTTYMQTILNHLKESNHPILSSSFSYLSIKKRFNMLQKKKSRLQQTSTITFSIILSLSLICLFAFKPAELNQKIEHQITAQTGFHLHKKPSGLPINFNAITKVPSSFGMRIHPITKERTLHRGDDLTAKEGTSILATDKGKVIKAQFSKNYGNHIIIQHNMKFKTLYAHLKSMNVKVGETVELGQTIGIIGNTGRSMGTHLHYELHEFDKPIDPKTKTAH